MTNSGVSGVTDMSEKLPKASGVSGATMSSDESFPCIEKVFAACSDAPLTPLKECGSPPTLPGQPGSDFGQAPGSRRGYEKVTQATLFPDPPPGRRGWREPPPEFRRRRGKVVKPVTRHFDDDGSLPC